MQASNSKNLCGKYSYHQQHPVKSMWILTLTEMGRRWSCSQKHSAREMEVVQKNELTLIKVSFIYFIFFQQAKTLSTFMLCYAVVLDQD